MQAASPAASSVSFRSWIVLAALIVIAFASIFLFSGGAFVLSQVAVLFKPSPTETLTETPTPTQTLAPGQTPTATQILVMPLSAISRDTASSIAPLRKFTQPDSQVYSVAFSPDGRALAFATFDGSIQLWDVSTGQLT